MPLAIYYLLTILLFPYLAHAQNLTDGQVDLISTRLAESALQRFVRYLLAPDTFSDVSISIVGNLAPVLKPSLNSTQPLIPSFLQIYYLLLLPSPQTL